MKPEFIDSKPIEIKPFMPTEKYNNGNPKIPDQMIQFALSSFMNHNSGIRKRKTII